MDTFINDDFNPPAGGIHVGKLLIATLYNADAVLVAAHRLGPDRLFLFIQEDPDEKVKKALALIEDSLGRVIEIKTKKVPAYDIVSVATKAVELIDAQPNDEKIYINITSGRKTLAIGLLLAAYARKGTVRKIAYNPEEDKTKVVYLPKLGFDLNNSQRKILERLAKGDAASIAALAEDVDVSKAMLYKTIQELKEMALVEEEDGLRLTDAGKIARL